MRALLSILVFPLVSASLLAQEPQSSPPPVAAPALTAEDRLEALNEDQIRAAIAALRQQHVEAEAIDDAAMLRATLRGLLAGLHPGAELTGNEIPAAAAAPFLSEILGEDTGYIRLGSLSTENITRLDAALGEFREKKVDAVVLDLRATPDSDDFELAAQAAERFVPQGAPLFSFSGAGGKVFTAGGQRGFSGVVAVVVDADTSGAAEALAASLRRHIRAMIVGEPTSGRAVQFAAIDLGDGHRLRLAVAEAQVEGLPGIYPRGLEPDLEVEQDATTRDAILAAAEKNGVAAFVFQPEREQLNEAALVAGTNPEISGSEENSASLVDRPLQSAVDLVTAIRLFRGQD
jgi:hypothetical protein